eukprot:Gb_17499 [translate_table: standard]
MGEEAEDRSTPAPNRELLLFERCTRTEVRTVTREELTEYQKQGSEQLLAKVEVEVQRWQTAGNARNGNTAANLQESMDNDLESHKLSHGPKTRVSRRGDDSNNVKQQPKDEFRGQPLHGVTLETLNSGKAVENKCSGS